MAIHKFRSAEQKKIVAGYLKLVSDFPHSYFELNTIDGTVTSHEHSVALSLKGDLWHAEYTRNVWADHADPKLALQACTRLVAEYEQH